jgi:hypothetical protein
MKRKKKSVKPVKKKPLTTESKIGIVALIIQVVLWLLDRLLGG